MVGGGDALHSLPPQATMQPTSDDESLQGG